jgi:hypothetical protein
MHLGVASYSSVTGNLMEKDLFKAGCARARVAPELHFLIREHYRLEVRRLSVVETGEVGFSACMQLH